MSKPINAPPCPSCPCSPFPHYTPSHHCILFPQSSQISHTITHSRTQRCASPSCPNSYTFSTTEPTVAHTTRGCLAHFHTACFWAYVARFPSHGADHVTRLGAKGKGGKKGRAQRACPRCWAPLDMFVAHEDGVARYLNAGRGGKSHYATAARKTDVEDGVVAENAVGDELAGDKERNEVWGDDHTDRPRVLRDVVAEAAEWSEERKKVAKRRYMEADLEANQHDIHTTEREMKRTKRGVHRDELQSTLDGLRVLQESLERKRIQMEQ